MVRWGALSRKAVQGHVPSSRKQSTLPRGDLCRLACSGFWGGARGLCLQPELPHWVETTPHPWLPRSEVRWSWAWEGQEACLPSAVKLSPFLSQPPEVSSSSLTFTDEKPDTERLRHLPEASQ